MNLLYTITGYPPSTGGAQEYSHQLVRRLATRHGVRVAAHWAETRTDWLLGTTLRSPQQAEVYALDNVPVHLLALSQAERLELAPPVLYYYLAKGLAIESISDCLVRHLEPLAEGVDLIHNGRMGREPLSYASLKLARRLGVPFILTPFHHPRWVGWNYRHYVRLYQQADVVIALTEVEKMTLAGLGVEKARVHVTGMGPSLASSHDGDSFRQAHGLDGPMILFLGQKYAYKGCEAMLGAAPAVWSRFSDACFVFIGPRTRHSRSLFGRQHDGRVLEMGVVDLETKTNALAACDMLCVPSTQESFGAVFPEAWMLGKPVIGGTAPAVREVISHGVDGWIVNQEPGAIAEAIIDLLAHPAATEEMGKRGMEKALARFTWERLARETEKAYQAALG